MKKIHKIDHTKYLKPKTKFKSRDLPKDNLGHFAFGSGLIKDAPRKNKHEENE